jgi:hypothetical protein
VHDLSAIQVHHANEIPLSGRYNTLFRSSFDVPTKVDATAILSGGPDAYDLASEKLR